MSDNVRVAEGLLKRAEAAEADHRYLRDLYETQGEALEAAEAECARLRARLEAATELPRKIAEILRNPPLNYRQEVAEIEYEMRAFLTAEDS